MSLLTRLEKQDPFEELTSLRNRMDRLFSRFADDLDQPVFTGNWMPVTDTFETKDRFVLRAELPGMDEKAIYVELESNVLTIKGERKFEETLAPDAYQRIERSYGKFIRTFTLPPDVDSEKISATYTNGILELQIPKKDEAKPRKIALDITPNRK